MEITEGHSKKWIDMNDRIIITDPHVRNDINYLRKLSIGPFLLQVCCASVYNVHYRH